MDRVLKSFAAGLAGTAAHLALMFLKSSLGLLPQFQPYEELQRAIALATGATVSAPAAFALSFVNGSLVLGFVFGRLYGRLPGGDALRKGLFFGLVAWAVLGLVVFPLIGRGPFAWGLGLGAKPAALMLLMLGAYSCAMSFAYAALTGGGRSRRP